MIQPYGTHEPSTACAYVVPSASLHSVKHCTLHKFYLSVMLVYYGSAAAIRSFEDITCSLGHINDSGEEGRS